MPDMDTDSFDHADDDDDAHEFRPTPEVMDFIRGKREELDAAAQKIGLYQQNTNIGILPKPDGTLALLITADFLPGKVAWSNRIQDPEADSFDDQFKDIAAASEKDEFEQYRAKLAEDLGIDDEQD